jgi:hypothetical protein
MIKISTAVPSQNQALQDLASEPGRDMRPDVNFQHHRNRKKSKHFDPKVDKEAVGVSSEQYTYHLDNLCDKQHVIFQPN